MHTTVISARRMWPASAAGSAFHRQLDEHPGEGEEEAGAEAAQRPRLEGGAPAPPASPAPARPDDSTSRPRHRDDHPCPGEGRQRLGQHDPGDEGALHRVRLGIGGADDKAAVPKGQDEKVGGDDLRDAPSRHPQPEQPIRRWHHAAEQQAVQEQGQQRERRAIQEAGERGAVDGEAPAQPLLQRRPPRLEQRGGEGQGQPEGGDDHPLMLRADPPAGNARAGQRVRS